MKEFGIAQSDLKLATELKFVEMAPALCDNKIDAFVFVAGHPNAIFQEAATSCASNIASVTGPPIDKLVAANPFYAKADVPGQDVQGHRHRAARVRRARHASSSAPTCRKPPPMRSPRRCSTTSTTSRSCIRRSPTSPRKARSQGNTVPFHPGAVKYFKEKGLLK